MSREVFVNFICLKRLGLACSLREFLRICKSKFLPQFEILDYFYLKLVFNTSRKILFVQQDDDDDVAAQIENMGNIYEPAYLIFESSSAVNANTGLSRTRYGT